MIVKLHQFLRQFKNGIRLSKMLYVGFCIMLCMWFISCTSRESTLDGLHIKDHTCVIPCWQGITPGMTDQVTTSKIISDPNLIEQESIITETSTSFPPVQTYRYFQTNGTSGRISIKDDIVYQIEIWPGRKELTLREVFKALGEPTYLYIKTNRSTSSCVEINFYYPHLGLTIESGDCDEDDIVYEIIDVTNDLEVYEIALFVPESDLESFLISSQLMEPESAQTIVQNAERWRGFDGYLRPFMP